MLDQPERGCLVLADISGYTGYLIGTELDHARDVLADLMGTVVGSLQPTLRVAKLEGDAAFAYAGERALDGTMLLDTVEGSYLAFRKRLRDVQQNTTCDCNACRQIPRLDLKFFAHHGAFVRQRIARWDELAGPDVILVHRLLKNAVSETFGLHGYALYTRACVDALGVDPIVLGMRPHVERYDELGTIPVYVHDLEARWRDEQERHRVFVAADDAEAEIETPVPVPPAILWEYLTIASRRLLWEEGITRIDEARPGGRRGAGTVNHCAHGSGTIVQEILDWRPFRYFTARARVPGFPPLTITWELLPAESGTTLSWRLQRIRGRTQRARWEPAAEAFVHGQRRWFARLVDAVGRSAAAGGR